MKKEISGIYAILNLKNQKCYIGSSLYIIGRTKNHLKNLKKEIVTSDEYYTGGEAFGFHEIIAETPDHEKQLADLGAEEIEKILREYGEEKFSKKIAKAIVEARRIKPIETTFQLIDIIPALKHDVKVDKLITEQKTYSYL